MIKLFVSDVDGTLLHDNSIDQKDIQAMQGAVRQGLDVCLASGRMYEELREVADRLDTRCHYVSQNGSFVHTDSGERIHSANFEPSLARELLTVAEEQQFPYTVSCSDNQIYVPQDENAANFKERMLMPVHDVPSISEVFEQGILPCKFAFFGNLDALMPLRERVNLRFPTEITTFVADKDCLDIMPRHVSKGEGLKSLLDHLKLTPQEVACVGDSFNDAAMFELIPHSFAMRHSDPDVQKVASHVVQSVARALEWVMEYNRAYEFS